VLTGGSLAVAVLYAGLAVAAWPLMIIAADETSPILQVPGSVSVGCLLLGFALLSVVTLCRLPEVWNGVEVPHGHDQAEPAAAHQGV
jgi:TRAP-type C4-dicarboxylate transport system permease small subunit